MATTSSRAARSRTVIDRGDADSSCFPLAHSGEATISRVDSVTHARARSLLVEPCPGLRDPSSARSLTRDADPHSLSHRGSDVPYSQTAHQPKDCGSQIRYQEFFGEPGRQGIDLQCSGSHRPSGVRDRWPRGIGDGFLVGFDLSQLLRMGANNRWKIGHVNCWKGFVCLGIGARSRNAETSTIVRARAIRESACRIPRM